MLYLGVRDTNLQNPFYLVLITLRFARPNLDVQYERCPDVECVVLSPCQKAPMNVHPPNLTLPWKSEQRSRREGFK